MRKIALFGEDFAHQEVIGALVRRLASEIGIEVQLDWRNAVGGHGRVLQGFKNYLRDLRHQPGLQVDAVIVATDANCKGEKRRKDFRNLDAHTNLVLAIPEPHVERWLLLDSSAFRKVLGKGCTAPDKKCDRDLYKQRYAQSVYDAGVTPQLGGLEHAQEIVAAMDLDKVAKDKSFGQFLDEIRSLFQGWRT